MDTNALVVEVNEQEQALFFRRTYFHVAMAVFAFILVEYLLIHTVPENFIYLMIGQKYSWLLVLGIFWLGSMLSNRWAMSQSKSIQYLGLAFFVLIEAIIFLPLIYLAVVYTDSNAILFQAAMLTLAMFAGLSGVALTSKRDFSFLRSIIVIGGFVALGLIVVGIIFGFNLGLWFSVGMVLLASASILYETNKLKNNFTPNQYVGASLQLFASVMLLFWYILRILMSRRN